MWVCWSLVFGVDQCINTFVSFPSSLVSLEVRRHFISQPGVILSVSGFCSLNTLIQEAEERCVMSSVHGRESEPWSFFTSLRLHLLPCLGSRTVPLRSTSQLGMEMCNRSTLSRSGTPMSMLWTMYFATECSKTTLRRRWAHSFCSVAVDVFFDRQAKTLSIMQFGEAKRGQSRNFSNLAAVLWW